MSGQFQQAARDRVARRLVACCGEEDEERGDLRVAEPLTIDLGLHQRSRQVIGWLLATPCGQLDPVRPDLVRDSFELREILLRLELAEDHVRPVKDTVLVLLADPHHRADDLER